MREYDIPYFNAIDGTAQFTARFDDSLTFRLKPRFQNSKPQETAHSENQTLSERIEYFMRSCMLIPQA